MTPPHTDSVKLVSELRDAAFQQERSGFAYIRANADLLNQAANLIERHASPVDMILHCPRCHLQHIDKPEPDADADGWNNPPHRSHFCHGCGFIWRPADVPTNGVAAIQTRGKNDSAPTAPASDEFSDFDKLLAEMERDCPLEMEAARQWVRQKFYGDVAASDGGELQEIIADLHAVASMRMLTKSVRNNLNKAAAAMGERGTK
jgi:hypothetical protein